ncbi:MAG TPA: hypothetical protein VFG04_01320 [Planctomycetaceae bacterium]|jgi:hypothetical protein|nr:hypothetical protein [Planctomycetaceae bacterium]
MAESAIGRISAACGNCSKRNSFINMTMKYAHIGIVDQAKAIAKLPAPRNGALHGRCILTVSVVMFCRRLTLICAASLQFGRTCPHQLSQPFERLSNCKVSSLVRAS